MKSVLPSERTHDPTPTLDVDRVRSHFDFPDLGRIVTNNAASTQPPRELAALLVRLTKGYENVHRGQSLASQRMTELFEASYDTFAQWLNAPSRRSIATYRNTTEAINAVMYSLLTEFRDGDNVVTTMLEHNSDFVPWYGMSREILPRFGRQVDCRVARFDHRTGELDLDHLAGLVDHRTKLVCVSGASNFLGTKPPLSVIRGIADDSGYRRDGGDSGSLMLVDAAQLVPSSYVDVQQLDVDYLAFSCHKMLAPFGVGVLYAKERLLARARPFLYGGDMIAEGRVAPDLVEYNDLPWKYAAGTPNILGVIASAHALRLLLDMVGVDGPHTGPPRRHRSRHWSSRRQWVASAGTRPSSPTWRCAKRCRSMDSSATDRRSDCPDHRCWRSTRPVSTPSRSPRSWDGKVSRPGPAATARRWPIATSA